jgi:hypothetical protein
MPGEHDTHQRGSQQGVVTGEDDSLGRDVLCSEARYHEGGSQYGQEHMEGNVGAVCRHRLSSREHTRIMRQKASSRVLYLIGNMHRCG